MCTVHVCLIVDVRRRREEGEATQVLDHALLVMERKQPTIRQGRLIYDSKPGTGHNHAMPATLRSSVKNVYNEIIRILGVK